MGSEDVTRMLAETYSQGVADGKAQAVAEDNHRLREALRDQWEWNHAEHCMNDPDHSGPCHWPRPVILGGDPAEYRYYERPL